MNIHTPIRRHIQNGLRQDLPKGDHHHNIRLIFPQFFDTRLLPDLLWLIDRDIVFQGCFLHRRILHLPAAALWLIRLRHCQHHLMPGLDQSFQCPHGKLRCPHKYDFHPGPSFYTSSSSSGSAYSTSWSSPSTRSTYKCPSKWSISWQKARARSPSPSSSISSISSFWAITLT